MPSTEDPPRDFEATVTDDNGWAVHVPDEEAAENTAGYLSDLAELYAPEVQDYLPDRGRLWAEAILIAFPSSEILTERELVQDEDDGDGRVY